MTRLLRYAAASACAGFAALQALGRRAGSTVAERREKLPGDDVVRHPQLRTDHAVTVDAAPDAVWPWLTQMGWHRGGYYTPRWVDRLLFPGNAPSLDLLDPRFVHDLAPGDIIPDGAAGTAWFVVQEVDAPHHLVLHSTTHLPPGWHERYGARIDWTWTFQLTEVLPGRTRLHLRVRARTAPWWLTLVYGATVVPADLVMGTGMLRGLKQRAEGLTGASSGAGWRPRRRRPRPRSPAA